MTVIETVTQRIVVNPPTGKLDIVGFGVPGPPGPPGPPGSGSDLAWPIVAPETSSGQIIFTPAVGNDIRGLQTPDGASWVRAWTGPPFAWYLKANSGPLTGGLMGAMFLDSDEISFRASSGTPTVATLRKTDGLIIDMNNTATGRGLILKNTGNANEGGELELSGGANYAGYPIQIDNYQGKLRVLMPGASGGVGLEVTAAGQLNISGNAALYFSNWGGGWYMQDTTWIRAAGDKPVYTPGEIRSGTGFSWGASGRIMLKQSGDETQLWGGGSTGYFANNHHFLNAAASAWSFRHSGGQFEVWGTTLVYGSLYGSNELYTGTNCWFRVRGNSGIYWENHGVGWYSDYAGILRLYGASVLSLDTYQRIRLYSQHDDNHHIRYSGDGASWIHPASGENSNGPLIMGYASVTLKTVYGAPYRTMYFNGHCNIDAAYQYAKFSSVANKLNISEMDGEIAMKIIRALRPIEFTPTSEPSVRRDGFTVEEVQQILPSICAYTIDGAKAVGIDYGQLTVRLTAAMKAMMAKIEDLERRLVS